MTMIKTGSWFIPLPDGHIRIGISRGVPRRQPAGFRIYRKLAPGPWFNSCATHAEYDQRYQAEILAPLNPRAVAAELLDLAGGLIPVMQCYERVPHGPWCHRALAAEWLAKGLGRPVPEVGFEQLPQEQHPYMSPELRRPVALPEPDDLASYVGRKALIEGELHVVIGVDPERPDRAIIGAGPRRFPAGVDTLRHHFPDPA